MEKQDFLKAFAEMPPEDQEAIRSELIGEGAPLEAGDPMAMCHEMMQKMMASGDPMAMCREMMGKMEAGCNPMIMCQDMMEKMKAGKDPKAICREMMGEMAAKPACP
jgi:hypothetical protein